MSTHGNASAPNAADAARQQAAQGYHGYRGALEIDQAGREALARVFDHPLTDAQIRSLVGADASDDVEVQSISGHPHLYLTAYRPTHVEGNRDAIYTSHRVLWGSHGQHITLDNHESNTPFALQGQGIATRHFVNQVRGARALGIKTIVTQAGAGGGLNGYYTWPRLGFDGPIDMAAIAADPENWGDVPHALRGATSMSELMAAPGGPAWWRAEGFEQPLTFDLRTNSPSMQTLNAYLKEKGLPPV